MAAGDETIDHYDVPAPPSSRTSRVYLWVPRRLMIDINYLVEGFEGLAMIRTLDTAIGLMEAMVTPGAEAEFLAVARKLAEVYPEIKIAPPPAFGRRRKRETLYRKGSGRFR